VVWGWNEIFALNHNVLRERSDGRVGTATNYTKPVTSSNEPTQGARRNVLVL